MINSHCLAHQSDPTVRSAPLQHAISQNLAPKSDKPIERIQQYYAEASEGYRDWSKAWNMHFGIYEPGCNPFKLEAMLENTNRHVLSQLQLSSNQNHLLDMGCGLGATVRFAATQQEVAHISGVSIVHNQVEEAKAISANHPNFNKMRFVLADYHHTPFSNEHFDGVFAIESACHSGEKDKSTLLKEAFRLLKPGARFVICDGFIKSDGGMNNFSQQCYRKTCEHWALGHFPHLNKLCCAMRDTGFRNITVQDLSWRILPSALYIPWMVLKYGAKLLWRRDKNPQHWHHLLAPIWGAALALNRKQFGYYMAVGKKPDNKKLQQVKFGNCA